MEDIWKSLPGLSAPTLGPVEAGYDGDFHGSGGDNNVQTLQMLIFRQYKSDNSQEGPAEPPWKKIMDYTQAPQVNLLQLRLVSLEKLTN